MKNRYVMQFLHRGLIFGGFGPIILGIVYFVLAKTITGFSLTGEEVMLGILSTFFLAFLHAGASVFNQIEHWSPAKSLAFHLPTLYAAYVICYVMNSWIPFEWMVIGIFTVIFVACYLVIWLTVYLCVRASSKRLNAQLK